MNVLRVALAAGLMALSACRVEAQSSVGPNAHIRGSNITVTGSAYLAHAYGIFAGDGSGLTNLAAFGALLLTDTNAFAESLRLYARNQTNNSSLVRTTTTGYTNDLMTKVGATNLANTKQHGAAPLTNWADTYVGANISDGQMLVYVNDGEWTNKTPTQIGLALLTDLTGSTNGNFVLRTNGTAADLSVYPEAYNANPLTVINNAGAPALTVSSNGNVGIGTNNPQYKLDVVTGNGWLNRFTDGTRDIRFYTASGIAALGSLRSGDDWRFFVDGDSSVGITIKSGGNVGIGYTDPSSYRLMVAGTGYFNDMLVCGKQSDTEAYNQGAIAGAGQNWWIRTATDNSFNLGVYNGGNSITAFRVNQNGNVGIGTNNPGYKLHVEGPGYFAGDVSFYTSASYGFKWGTAKMLFDGQAMGIKVTPYSANYVGFSVAGYAGQTYPLQQWTDSAGNVYSMVDNVGKFGIGTVSPIAKLHIATTNGFDGPAFVVYQTNGYPALATLGTNGVTVVGTNVMLTPSSNYKLQVNGGAYASSAVVAVGGFYGNPQSPFSFNGRGDLTAAGDGFWSVANNSADNFSRLVFGTNSITTNTVNRYASLSFTNGLADSTPVMAVTAQDGLAPADLWVKGNVTVEGAVKYPTNALVAAGGTDFQLNMNRQYGLYVASGNISITNLLNVDMTKVNNHTLLINDNGAERSVTIPSSWYSHDGAHTYYVSNAANIGVLSVCVYPQVATNVVFRLFNQ